jgi:hypothetical protein
MAYIVMWGDENDPGFRYESLARYSFNCNAHGGPNGVAHQGVYNSLLIPEISKEGILVFNQILDSLIEREENPNKITEYNILKESISDGMEQRTAIDLIDYIIQIIRED